MNTQRTIPALIIIPFLFILSCKRKSLAETADKKAPQTEEPSTGEPFKKILIPVKLKSDQLTINIKYEKNSAIITEITGSDDYKVLITHKTQRYIIMDSYTNNKVTNSINFIFTGDKINLVNLFDEEDRVIIPTGSYALTYNTKNQLATIKNYGTDLIAFRESSRTYDEKGNLSGITTLDYPNEYNYFTYTHDEKNGIFKHVKFAQELFLALKYQFFNAGVNNVLSYSATKTPSVQTTFSYQYNADDYPSKITIHKDKQQTFEITYAELKP